MARISVSKDARIAARGGSGGGSHEPDDRLGLEMRPAQIEKARAHLTVRLRRLLLESIYSAAEYGAVYRTLRDIQALDMIRALQPDAVEAPRAAPQSPEDAAEAQRQAHAAHKAKEERDAASERS